MAFDSNTRPPRKKDGGEEGNRGERRPAPDPSGNPRLLITSLLPDLRGYARFLARDRSQADDLVQDTVVRALSALDQFEPGTNLKAWMFTILRNIFYEQARRRKRERALIEENNPEAASITPAPQTNQAVIADLDRLLWTLPPVLREALVLVGAQELSYEEAAAICEVPVGTMKARVSRARAQLTKSVEGETLLEH